MSEKEENTEKKGTDKEHQEQKPQRDSSGKFLPGNKEGEKKKDKKHKNTEMIEKIEELKGLGLIKSSADLKMHVLATAAYFLFHGTKKERKEAYKDLMPYIEPKLKSSEIKFGDKPKIIRVFMDKEDLLKGKEPEEPVAEAGADGEK